MLTTSKLRCCAPTGSIPTSIPSSKPSSTNTTAPNTPQHKGKVAEHLAQERPFLQPLPLSLFPVYEEARRKVKEDLRAMWSFADIGEMTAFFND